MATPDRFKPQLDDIPLKLEFITDGCERSFAEYEPVGTDGSEFEDLGAKARTFSVRAWFYRDSYADYQAFETALNNPDTIHNFVHPAHGLMFGVVPSWNSRHDERQRTAVVDFVFKEQLQGDIENKLTPLIVPAVEDSFVTGQQQSVDAYKEKLSAQFGSDAIAMITRPIAAGESMLSALIDQTAVVRQYVAKVETAVTAFEGLMSSIEQPANTLIASIEYGTTLPERLLGTIAATIDRYASLVDTATDAPYAALQSFYNGTLAISNAAADFSEEIKNVRAQTGALLAARMYAADDEDRGQAAIIEKTPVWNTDGEYVGAASTPYVMTVNDLERTVGLVRQHLQEAFDFNRSATALHDMAAALLRHVNVIKLDRERIVEIDVPESIPMQLLCHKRGLGYRAAERIMRINPQIKNPAFTSGTVAIYE